MKNDSDKFVFKKGFFAAGQGHELYFEFFGNPKGQPVVFLHGGPGAGFSKKDRVFFNPKKFNVLFFDQRGAGKSKTKNILQANTTDFLVNDIEKLMNFAGFKKAIVFGGSWGSTLALLFALKHPQRVSGLVLRGIFLADQTGREHFYLGGIKKFFPKEYQEFISLVPKKYGKNPEKYYYQKMLSGNKKIAKKFMHAWAKIEMTLIKLKTKPKEIEKFLAKKNNENFALIECHFLSKNCFVSFDYIKKNLQKIQHIPCTVVHGRYDMVCTPQSAFELHNALPKSRLFFTIAGHASREKETKQKLIQELNKMAK